MQHSNRSNFSVRPPRKPFALSIVILLFFAVPSDSQAQNDADTKQRLWNTIGNLINFHADASEATWNEINRALRERAQAWPFGPAVLEGIIDFYPSENLVRFAIELEREAAIQAYHNSTENGSNRLSKPSKFGPVQIELIEGPIEILTEEEADQCTQLSSVSGKAPRIGQSGVLCKYSCTQYRSIFESYLHRCRNVDSGVCDERANLGYRDVISNCCAGALPLCN